jgi:hypothetical protein
MTNLLAAAFKKAQNLPKHLQNELAEQLMVDIESELNWQHTLSQPQSSILEKLATQALQDSSDGKTNVISFDHL